MSEQEKAIELLEKIDKKLGFIIGDKIKEKYGLVKDQVNHLTDLTLDYKDIAAILGITPKHASVELSKLKKRWENE